jgi:hypothetical protein
MSTAAVEKGIASRPEPEPLWRRADLARFFGVSVFTVKGWQVGGRLPEPACTIAGRAYWRQSDIRAMLAATSETEAAR